MPKIKSITCHEILDSRGEWTVETTVTLEDGSEGVQPIPSGASKGENEAVYIPVAKAVEVVSTVINDALVGEEAEDQAALDRVLISMDGTPNKRNLGGNSILGVSLGVAKAVAKSKGIELYEYLSILHSGKKITRDELKFPTPVLNILNGGKHASNGLSFQEFMIIPSSELGFDKQMEMGSNIYHDLKDILEKEGFATGVGDEGGFAPEGFTAEKALEFIKKAASKNYSVGKNVFFGMDVAAESFFNGEEYEIPEQKLTLNQDAFLSFYGDLLKKFELIYIEDPFYEKDVKGWKMFHEEFGEKLMVVADDLVVTNPKFLEKAIEKKLANAVIIKPNQVGTLTETLDFIKMAQGAKMELCVSHRSGDTAEDTFIADLALGVGAGFMKSGAPVRGERVAKYNRLLDIFFEKEKA